MMSSCLKIEIVGKRYGLEVGEFVGSELIFSSWWFGKHGTVSNKRILDVGKTNNALLGSESSSVLFRVKQKMPNWRAAAATVAAMAVLLLAVTDTHTGAVTRSVSSVLVGAQSQTQMLDVVRQRTWFDRYHFLVFDSISVIQSHNNDGIDNFFRIKDAAIGFLVGIILFFGSFFFAFAIEKFAVQKWLVTGRAKRACVANVDSSSVNANLNRRVIHTTGRMSAEDSAKDTELNFIPDQNS